LFDDYILFWRAFRGCVLHYFHYSTLLGLPDLFGFVQSAGKLFLRLLATTLVESISLWHRERAAANTDLTPSWRQVHGAVTRKVMGRIAKNARLETSALRLNVGKRSLNKSQCSISHIQAVMMVYESIYELIVRYNWRHTK
jgi:hypothetical protein